MKRLFLSRLRLIISILAFVFVAAGWFWAYLSLRGVNGPIVLHYNSTGGINSIGGLRELSEIGFFGSLVVLMNGWIAFELDKKDGFWGILMAVVTLIFGILIFIGYGAIISVNY